jgi:hypothetical protein
MTQGHRIWAADLLLVIILLFLGAILALVSITVANAEPIPVIDSLAPYFHNRYVDYRTVTAHLEDNGQRLPAVRLFAMTTTWRAGEQCTWPPPTPSRYPYAQPLYCTLPVTGPTNVCVVMQQADGTWTGLDARSCRWVP